MSFDLSYVWTPIQNYIHTLDKTQPIYDPNAPSVVKSAAFTASGTHLCISDGATVHFLNVYTQQSMTFPISDAVQCNMMQTMDERGNNQEVMLVTQDSETASNAVLKLYYPWQASHPHALAYNQPIIGIRCTSNYAAVVCIWKREVRLRLKKNTSSYLLSYSNGVLFIINSKLV